MLGARAGVDDGLPSVSALRKLAEVFNTLVEDGTIGYGVLGSVAYVASPAYGHIIYVGVFTDGLYLAPAVAQRIEQLLGEFAVPGLLPTGVLTETATVRTLV